MPHLEREIMNTVALSHQFGTAFTREQVMRFIRLKTTAKNFDLKVAELVAGQNLYEHNEFLYLPDHELNNEQCRKDSQTILLKEKKLLSLISALPWVKFVGLTGRNAFQSCRLHDDIDLFIITRRKRLWVTYLLLVVILKAVGKREHICLNYLLDEDHLALNRPGYFTAVQLVQMQPLYNPALKDNLLAANSWHKYYLPNSSGFMNEIAPLRVGGKIRSRPYRGFHAVDRLNRRVFKKYYERLEKNFGHLFGESMILEEGIAKLHRNDHHDSYDQIRATPVTE